MHTNKLGAQAIGYSKTIWGGKACRKERALFDFDDMLFSMLVLRYSSIRQFEKKSTLFLILAGLEYDLFVKISKLI